MKRLLSFILAAVMALSLMPISFAMEQNKLAEEKTTDITLLYDMCKLDVVAASDNALSEITYAETGGFWRYHSMQKPNKNVNVRNGALQITKDNAWVAIGIYVPVAGEYSIELAYTTYRQHGAIGGMYILPGDTEDVATALANGDAYCVGSEISYIDTFLSGTSGSSKLISSEKHYFSEGEHLIVYKRESNAENNGTTNDQRMYPGLITLKQGNGGVAPIGFREKQIGVGEKTKLTAYRSDVRIRSGYVKEATGLSYSSSNNSVATVSQDGTVTGVGIGTATITATGSEYAAPYTVTVNVTKDRNLIVKYDLGGIIKSGGFNYASGTQRPITDMTERLTNGFFRFSSASGTEYTTDADMCFHGSGSSQGHIEIKAGKWIEFEIYVPVKGTYTMNVHHAMYKDFGDMTVYVNGETDDGWKYSCHDNSTVNMTVYKADKLTDIELNAGWNKVKFEVSSTNSGSVGSFELVSGNGKVALLMGAEVTFDGDVAKVRGINSDGTDADISKATLTWKSDNTEVAKINSKTGEIDNIHKGKANISVDVYIDDYNKAEASAEYEVTVEPPPPIDFAGEENSSTISFIDVSADWQPHINAEQGMSDATRVEDVRGITYEYTDGKWCWYGTAPGTTPGVESAMVWRYKGIESYHNRARFNIAYNKWVALKVKIPARGRYAVSFDYATFSSGAENEIYFVPVVPLKEVDALLTRKNRVGTFDYLPDVQGEYALLKKFIGNFEFEAGGEYLLIMKNLSPKGYAVNISPRRLILDGTNSFKYVEVSVDDEDKLLTYKQPAQVNVSAHLADGTVISPENYTVSYASTNENILAVDDTGKITALGDGSATITATVTYGEETYYKSLEISAFDNTEFLGAVLEIPEELYVRETAKMDFYALMESGNRVRSMQNVKYEYSEPGIVEVLESGVVNALAEGKVRVTVSGKFRGETVSVYKDITVTLHEGKQGSALYPGSKRKAALSNVSKYSWAKSTVESTTNSADYYIESLDVILKQLCNDGWPRSRQMGFSGDTTYNVCKYCSYDVAGKHGYNGSGGWDIDMINRPFKVQCPDCKRLFPSNNFEGFFKLGFDENGIWSRQTALDAHRAMLIEKGLLTDNGEEAPTEDRTDAWYKYYGYGIEGGYLYNELYEELWKENSDARNIDPRTGDAVEGLRWGVDDSYGYYPGRKAGTVDENHCYLPYYSYFMLTQVRLAINNIANAYLYTGDMKYGRAGAILLDKFADIYPSYDIYKHKRTNANWMVTDGGAKYGKIQGQIGDCQFATDLAQACDALYPALNDPEVIKYLSEKDPEKSSSLKIWENWANGILKEIFKGAKTGQIRGNFGSEHQAVATAAIVIDCEPETSEMLEWLYAANTGDVYQNIKGGELGLSLVNNVDRDGMCNEASPYYLLNMWLTALYPTADRLALYKGKEDYNLYENPKFVKLFTCVPSMVLTDTHIVQIGDTGATAGLEFIGGKDLFIEAFKNLKNTPYAEKIARYLWLINGKTSEGLRYGIFEEDPESLEAEIDALVENEKTAESEMMAGFGFAVLRAGKNYTSANAATANNNQRDFWMYFGRNGANAAHGHFDTLNIGIEAFGLNLSPDIGYPANTGTDPQRAQWVSRDLSHNTVMVDEKSGQNFVSADPLHFDDAENVKLMDVDASDLYKETEVYRRSLVMIKVNDDVSYGIDFFRVNGGNTHTFSFHAQSEKAEAIDGVSFTQDPVVQDADGKNIIGSYAGPEVAYGPDPDTQNAWSYVTRYPRGYTWMYDVRRDAKAEKNFTVDFAITDYRKAIADNKNIHLRVTQLNNFEPDEVALTKGAVPARSQNKAMPEGLEYMIVQRRGENLDSLFTTVYEPYRRTRYIEGIEQLPVDDVPETDTTVKAVKVTHSGGQRMDYIVYSTDNSKTYTVRDTDGSVALTFRGFVGVVTKNAEGAVTYRYVNDGDEISGTSGKAASYTGRVTGFEKELGFNNYIDVEFEGNPDLSDIEGRYINVANNATFNGAYLIKSVTDNREADGTVRLDIGDHTLINSYWDSTFPEDGFNFNIMEDQTFVIPTSFEEDFSPIFDDVSNNITTSAGSSVSVTVNAESPITENAPTITYIGTTLPRGASIDSVTGAVTWKPDASQIGENHFAVTARDADGRESTVHFTITVYGSTTGSSSSNKTEESDKSETPSTEPAGTPAGGGGGGGGGAAPTDKPNNKETDAEENTPAFPNDSETPQPNVGEGTSAISQFTDLGNHSWAADAIASLAADGIIKGTSGNSFSPASNITRADFALLLVRAFKLTSDNTENFADVTADDYFATELAIARNNDIIGGIGDNKFAPRNSITRQDMMVIVYRALQKLNVGFGIYDEPENADFATVAPYARDAVSALIGAGLVNGKNGNIAPMDYTTRAEVAVLIKRILDYTKNNLK